MSRKVYIVGVGMTKFTKPSLLSDYPPLAKEAVLAALSDSNLNYNQIEHATCGYVYGDSTCGQKSLYEVGLTGIPIVNVNNNCSTGSTALCLAKAMVQGGLHDCVLALGFDKMERGSLGSKYKDRLDPMQKHIDIFYEVYGMETAPVTAQLFGQAGKEHMRKYGTKVEHFAKIALKNHKHSRNNPNSQSQEDYSLEDILNSPKVFDFLTKLQCCPTSDGAAAAILASESFVHRHRLQKSAVEILALEMHTDEPSTFERKSAIDLVGFHMSRKAAEKAYMKAKVRPENIDVIELHDCFSCNELLTYEALGLCAIGDGKTLVDSGNNTYGGKYVINPSGGLISKGHPLGATGLAQCAELCWQLRGMAGKRQLKNAKLALQHNIGLGGAAVVGIYKLGFSGDNSINKSDNMTKSKL